MKKQFKLYICAWCALLVLFNIIAFVFPGIEGQEKYTLSFWIGYVLITLTFIGQSLCAVKAFNADNANKSFYNLSLIKVSYIGLIISFIVGSICMMIPQIPYWISVIVCAVVLAINIISVVGAKAAIAEVERIDEKIKTQTFFIKSLTVDANALLASAKSEEAKAECRKVYEAIRYSDPMSNDALSSIENQITEKFEEFSEALKNNDAGKIAGLANEVMILVAERNNQCKLLK